jgi:hypothetical protein
VKPETKSGTEMPGQGEARDEGEEEAESKAER